MRKIISFALVVTIFVTFFNIPVTLSAEAPLIFSELEEFLVNSESVSNDGYIGIPVNVNTYVKGTTNSQTAVAVYVMNHRMERVGTESDLSIVSDLLDEGYIVVALDYLNNPLAVSPEVEWSIQGMRRQMMDNNAYLAGLYKNKNSMYILPEGYRIVRDIPYFSIDEHASKGTLEYIVNVWNNEFRNNSAKWAKVPEEYRKTAETIEDCVKPDGSPLDMDLRMDIIYPSQPENKPPVFLYPSTSETRNITSCNAIRPHHTGMLMRGYACVVYDHEYIPMARNDHYGYFEPYSLMSWNGVKNHTAAVRRVRMLASEYGYDTERIGVSGHSKSAYSMLLSKANPVTAERLSYEGFPQETYGEQPWLTYEDGTPIPSNVQCCYTSMGLGPLNYSWMVDGTNAPTIIACGKYDEYGAWDYWPQLQKAYTDKNLINLAMGMSDLGHDLPYGIDPDLNYDRFEAYLDFFDYYLKPGTAPKLVWTKLEDNTDNASFPGDIVVKFNAPISEEEVTSGVVVKSASSGSKISGTWTSRNGDTEWIFSSDSDVYKEATVFNVAVSDDIKDENGSQIANGGNYRLRFERPLGYDEYVLCDGDETLSYNRSAGVWWRGTTSSYLNSTMSEIFSSITDPDDSTNKINAIKMEKSATAFTGVASIRFFTPADVTIGSPAVPKVWSFNNMTSERDMIFRIKLEQPEVAGLNPSAKIYFASNTAEAGVIAEPKNNYVSPANHTNGFLWFRSNKNIEFCGAKIGTFTTDEWYTIKVHIGKETIIPGATATPAAYAPVSVNVVKDSAPAEIIQGSGTTWTRMVDSKGNTHQIDALCFIPTMDMSYSGAKQGDSFNMYVDYVKVAHDFPGAAPVSKFDVSANEPLVLVPDADNYNPVNPETVLPQNIIITNVKTDSDDVTVTDASYEDGKIIISHNGLLPSSTYTVDIYGIKDTAGTGFKGTVFSTEPDTAPKFSTSFYNADGVKLNKTETGTITGISSVASGSEYAGSKLDSFKNVMAIYRDKKLVDVAVFDSNSGKTFFEDFNVDTASLSETEWNKINNEWLSCVNNTYSAFGLNNLMPRYGVSAPDFKDISGYSDEPIGMNGAYNPVANGETKTVGRILTRVVGERIDSKYVGINGIAEGWYYYDGTSASRQSCVTVDVPSADGKKIERVYAGFPHWSPTTYKNYLVRSTIAGANAYYETNKVRTTGWHRVTFDFSSGTDFKILIDGEQIYQSDAVSTIYGVGFSGPGWDNSVSTYYDKLSFVEVDKNVMPNVQAGDEIRWFRVNNINEFEPVGVPAVLPCN